MSVWESAPAYSIGSKSKNDGPKQKIPGPGTYDPQNLGAETSPQWKMGSANKGLNYKSDTPGPGTYEAKLISTNDLKYTMRPKFTDDYSKHAAIPGPGTYEQTAGSLVKYSVAPAYSLGARNSVERINTIPGPGQYDSDPSKTFKSGPAFSLRPRLELQNRSLEIPGPGAYDDKPDTMYKYTSQNIKFGQEKRDAGADTKRSIPAPGAYEIKGSFELGKGFSMLAKTGQGALSSSQNIPGPGTYQPKETILVKSAPSWKLGLKPKDNSLNRAKDLPGPGAYEPNLKNLRGAPGYKMEGSERMGRGIKQTNPGPGSYELKAISTSEGPKYSLRGKVEQQHRNLNPGPGAYSPETHMVNKKDPTFKLGKETRDTFKVDHAKPGPGHYDVHGKQLGPSYGFGKEVRGKHRAKAGPSPGMYEIPSTIGHVPAYAIKGILCEYDRIQIMKVTETKNFQG